MLSALWMDKYYHDYKPLSIVNRLHGGQHKLIEKFVKFTDYELENLSPNTKLEIMSLLGIQEFNDLV